MSSANEKTMLLQPLLVRLLIKLLRNYELKLNVQNCPGLGAVTYLKVLIAVLCTLSYKLTNLDSQIVQR